MNHPARIRRLALVAVALATAAWFVFRSSSAPEARPSAVDGTTLVGQGEAIGSEARGMLSSAEDEQVPEAERSATPVEVLVHEAERRNPLPADVIWIEGQVRIPAGTPAEERIRVVARGRRFKGLDEQRTHESEVAEDGSFRVAFASKTRRGYLELRARFLYLESKVRLELPLSGRPVVLEPELGAWVRVDVILPMGLELDSAEAIDIQLRTRSGDDREGERSQVGLYGIGGVPPWQECQIEVSSAAFWDSCLIVDALTPAQTLNVEMRPRPGVRLSGRVVDAKGAPIAEAELTARSGRSRTRAQSQPDGSFSVAGIPPGELLLIASHAQHSTVELPLGELADGDVREDLELRLPSGGIVAGRVSLEDGGPVAGVTVEVVLIDPDGWTVERVGSAGETDEEGRYQVSGLHSGRYWVRATVERASLAFGQSPAAGALPIETWTETRKDVEVPGPDVNFAVGPGHELRGRVVDDRGLPIDTYWLKVVGLDLLSIDSQHGFSREFATERIGTWHVRDSAGDFVVSGLPPGAWELSVNTPDHSKTTASIDVPGMQEVVVTLVRDARVQGVVVSPEGVPVERATLEVCPILNPEQRPTFKNPAAATTNANGQFVVKLKPGDWVLRADARGHQISPERELSLSPGDRVDGLLLTLSRPGALQVTLHSDFVVPGSAEVELSRAPGGSMLSVTLQPGQSREFAELDPGGYSLTAYALRGSDHDSGSSSRGERLLREEFQVRAEERVEIVLGRPSTDDQVLAQGRVTRAGAPAAGVHLQWRCIETGWVGSAECDEEGAYELGLGGEEWFEVRIGSERIGWSKHDVEVDPGLTDFNRDFEIPSGFMSGHVLDDAGKSMNWVQVSAARREPGGSFSYFSGRVGVDGGFTIGPLESGTYHLLADASARMSYETDGSGRFAFSTTIGGYSKKYGRLRVDGIQVSEREPTEGLELHLPRPATLQVRAKNQSGGSAAGAKLSISYADGLSPRISHSPKTDAFGRATIQALGPGDYLVQARLDDSESELIPVTIGEGETVKVELHLRP